MWKDKEKSVGRINGQRFLPINLGLQGIGPGASSSSSAWRCSMERCNPSLPVILDPMLALGAGAAVAGVVAGEPEALARAIESCSCPGNYWSQNRFDH